MATALLGNINTSSSDICPSCCPGCSTGNQVQLHSTRQGLDAPYSLGNLLAAGTLVVNLDSDIQEFICNHVHAEDGWHPFQHNVLKDHLAIDDASLCKEIKFLTEHRFVSVTYRAASLRRVFMRIYFIPFDLANVQGKLRVRKEIILGPARRYLRALLPKITQDSDSWNGNDLSSHCPTLIPSAKDNRTLAEIYGDLQSPQARVTPGYEAITRRLLDFDDRLEGLGMRSSMYKYQRRSVTAMIQKEMDATQIPDPLFIPLTSMFFETFYLQPGTMEILRERLTVAACRSGVLCEELGTGKTVIILALILATIHQISSPEESIMDDRHVMTPLSFRYFPSAECTSTRKRFFRGKEDTFDSQSCCLPSFVELLLHRKRTTPDTSIPNTATVQGLLSHERHMEIVSKVEQIHLDQLLQATTPFYYHYEGEPTTNERTQRKGTDPGPRRVYLTSATLIIVPANLLGQWGREIQKHVEYPIRVLILRQGTPMPHVTALASDYDIILMTYQRFTFENNFRDKRNLHCWNACRCPEYSGSRVPQCICKPPNVSSLLQIRWKRLVIDEGHVSASLSTILTPFTKLLSTERRWIVTGTPTTNLLGLSLGKKITEEAKGQVEDDLDEFVLGDDELFESQDSSETFSRASSLPPDTEASLRIWNKYDREDLNKLGRMITHFISVPQFAADPRLVQTHVVEPLFDRRGPRFGATQVLTQVMKMIMVRHRIEDVEEDVILPPVKQEAILLDLDPYAVKSYNAMLAAIAINAVDSQRTDQDYMFHPRAADFLQITVQNMSQLMFWSTDEGLYNVDQLTQDAQDHINTAMKRNVPKEDMELLREAFKHIEYAAKDPLWRTMQGHEDVPYRTYGIERVIFDAWTRTPLLEPCYNGSVSGFMHADRLLKIRDVIISRPRISQENLIELGYSVASKDRQLRRQFQESQKGSHRKAGRKAVAHQDDSNAIMMAGTAAKKARDPETIKEMKKELDVAIARLDNPEGEDFPLQSSKSPKSLAIPSSLLATSLLGLTRLGSTTSTKLNYIINEVLQYASSEKFLIFSDSELSLAHVAEALELMHVKYLRFTTQIEPRLREQLVLTFETSETYRVFLMELKHGARGLNLISASRVIFCEPIWQADVESQAIKRAHRIGQTRTITVKTLAIRGTAEENMVARRNALKDRQEKLPKLIEEAGMRHYIANPKFINYASERVSTVDVPLLKIPPTSHPPTIVSLLGKRVQLEDPVSPVPITLGAGSPTDRKSVV